MRAVIIANGKIENIDKIKRHIKDGDYIICADGGYDYAVKMGIVPDIIIGDMDSVKTKTADIEKIVFPVKKDFTDSEIVLEYAAEKGFDELLLLGFTGKRTDHMLTNILLLTHYPNMNITILDEYSEIILSKSENVIYGEAGTLVSIIPINGDLCGVTTDGLEYPLADETLKFGCGRGVSNVMLSDKCVIKIKSGFGIIIKSTD